MSNPVLSPTHKRPAVASAAGVVIGAAIQVVTGVLASHSGADVGLVVGGALQATSIGGFLGHCVAFVKANGPQIESDVADLRKTVAAVPPLTDLQDRVVNAVKAETAVAKADLETKLHVPEVDIDAVVKQVENGILARVLAGQAPKSEPIVVVDPPLPPPPVGLAGVPAPPAPQA